MTDDNMITVEMVGIKNEREELLIKLWWNKAIETAVKILETEHEIEPQHIPVRITTAMNKIRSLKK